MSYVDPIVPVPTPRLDQGDDEHDIDHDTDVIFDAAGDEGELEVDHTSPPPPFRTPHPGDGLSEAELESDLEV